MKKTLVSAFAAVVSATAFAGMNDIVISFSTPGPDKYSDGATVCDGERYALVWTPDGETFNGINADATAVGNSKVVTTNAVAVGGCCPSVQYEVDEDLVNKTYPNGKWSVVMLDTRTFRFNGSTGEVVVGADGKRVVESVGGPVIGYGVIGEPTIADAGDIGATAGGIAALSNAAAAGIEAPVVEDIKVDGDDVTIRVRLAKPAFKYTLMSGSEPGSVVALPSADSKYGKADETVELHTTRKPGGEFFKVNCKYE